MRLKQFIKWTLISAMIAAPILAIGSLGSTTNRNDYTGNGTTDTFSYTFRIIAESDLLVTVEDDENEEHTLTLTTDYTVTGEGDSGGGTVVLVDNNQSWIDADGDLVSGYNITIRRVRDLTQETDIRNQGDYYPESHEDAFDHFIMIAQQLQDQIDRSVKLRETDYNDDMILPNEDERASKFFTFDANGLPSVSASTTTPPVTSYISDTTVNLSDNQSATNVSGLAFSGATQKSAIIEYEIYRYTTGGSGVEYRQTGLWFARYKTVAQTWEIYEGEYGGEDAGVTPTITSAGQVQAATTDEPGTADTFTLKFRARIF